MDFPRLWSNMRIFSIPLSSYEQHILFTNPLGNSLFISLFCLLLLQFALLCFVICCSGMTTTTRDNPNDDPAHICILSACTFVSSQRFSSSLQKKGLPSTSLQPHPTCIAASTVSADFLPHTLEITVGGVQTN